MNDENRPKAAPDMAGTNGSTRLEVEAHLRAAGRLLEWAAVAEPDLMREARIIFLAAQRIRSRRLERAA